MLVVVSSTMRVALSVLFGLLMVPGCFATNRDYDVFERCETSNDCSPSYDCTRVRTTTTEGDLLDGRMCTTRCTSDATCPGNHVSAEGACYGVEDDTDPDRRACFARCVTDRDCESGSLCFRATGDGIEDFICMPQ